MAKHKKATIAFGVQDSAKPTQQVIWLVVLSILFFLTICLSSNAIIKSTAMVLICLTVLGGILCFPTLRGRIRLPLVILLLFVLMGGISTSYALSGKFALQEFLKLLTALCAGLLLLMLTPGTGVNPGRRIATVLEGSAALAALFSVDLISTRWLSTPLLSWLGSKSADYLNLAGVEPGVRMTSIFTNPNIFAGCVGIGLLLSLGLVLSSPGRKERCVHLVCLMICSTAFLLAFSMGATVAIAAAFLIYLLIEHKDRRGDLFVLMVETLILAAAAAVLSSAVAFDRWDGFQPIPLLALIVGSLLLCLSDRFLGQPLSKKLFGHGKLLLIIIAVLIVAALVFALVAYNMTGSVQLESGEELRRSVYPDPGFYTLSVQGSGDVQITVEAQNQYDTMMHTSTTLYSGALSDAAFTVPEDTLVVYLTFKANAPVDLVSAELTSAAGSYSVPLDYTLLPSFIANRLQGLFANQNAIQRVVFFQDGIKLFKDSPVVGFGLGAFENAIHRVQSFFYETKYVHNHYIQTLLETGIIGLLLFAGLIVASAVSIVLSRKKESFHPLTPALGALLVFMAIHAATEVVFSTFPYLPLAFGVFMLINLCCGDAISLKWLSKKVCTIILAVVAALILFFAILLGCNMTARRISDTHKTFDALERSMKLDSFEWADYALSYVMSSMQNNMPEEIISRAEEIAEKLAAVNSNTIPIHLSEYYLSNQNMELGFSMAEQYGSYLSASSNAWNNLFTMLEQFRDNSSEYKAGIQRVADIMYQWDETHIGSITLTPENQAFLDQVLAP